MNAEMANKDLFGLPVPLCRCGCGEYRRDGSAYATNGCRGRYSRNLAKKKSHNRRKDNFSEFMGLNGSRVFPEYLKVAKSIKRAGLKRARSRMIHEIACFNLWRKYKMTVNNTHAPFILRKLVADYPEFSGFIQFREN